MLVYIRGMQSQCEELEEPCVSALNHTRHAHNLQPSASQSPVGSEYRLQSESDSDTWGGGHTDESAESEVMLNAARAQVLLPPAVLCAGIPCSLKGGLFFAGGLS